MECDDVDKAEAMAEAVATIDGADAAQLHYTTLDKAIVDSVCAELHEDARAEPKTNGVGKKASYIYSYTEETINLKEALAFAELTEAKLLRIGSHTYRQIIHIFVQRARNIDEHGRGVIWSAWWEPERARGDLAGRRYSGIRGKAPEWLPKEEKSAPCGFQCLSPFALPRLLRQVLRTDTDTDDCDLRLSHVQMQLRRHDGKLNTPITKDLFENRDERLKEVIQSPWGQRNPTEEHAKELFASLVCGAACPDDAGQFVKDFAAEQETIREVDAERHGDALKLYADRHRPKVSLQVFLNMNEERRCLDVMQDLAWNNHKLKVGAYEHDGIAGAGWHRAMAKFEEQGLYVKLKPVPRNFSELLDLARATYPELPWTPNDDIHISASAVQVVRDDPLKKALSSIAEKGPVNHMAFAQVIVRELGDTYALEREDKEALVVQWFHESRFIWKRAGGARRLRKKAYDILNRVAIPSASLEEDDEAPAIYGDTHFLSSVVNELKCNLKSSDEYAIWTTTRATRSCSSVERSWTASLARCAEAVPRTGSRSTRATTSRHSTTPRSSLWSTRRSPC